jgi:Tol biopolymer transport system component
MPRSRFHILLLAPILWIVFASCSSLEPDPAPGEEFALYAYRLDPPALLQMSADLETIEREIPLDLPPACQIEGLHPSPRGDALAAELICPNGPVTLLVQPDSGVTSPLLQDNTIDSHFLAWSDGRSAYLRVNSLADPRILRVDTDTLRARDLPIDSYTYDLAASPDGKRILFSFSRGIGFGSEIWVADPDGRGAKRLLADLGNILALARWSPDGEGIAFIKIPDTQTPYSVGGLWVMEADGSGLRKLADADAGHGYAAAWSPEGTRLAFVVRSNPEDPRADGSLEALVSNIALLDISTGAVTQVTHFTRGRAETPLWSPDGNTLWFTFVLDGRMDVQFADLTGGTGEYHPGESVCCPVWLRK